MPPEMIRRKAYNQAVDWWALGALIYEMVTGYPPFRHKNRKKLHQKILNEKVRLMLAHCQLLVLLFGYQYVDGRLCAAFSTEVAWL